jgi:hypothetical protein
MSEITPSGFNKEDMKQTKRLSIEFWHREVTITMAGSTFHAQDIQPDAANTATGCPICGSPWITITASGSGDVPASADSIRRELQRHGLHLRVSPAGQLQICRRSFDEIKEKF